MASGIEDKFAPLRLIRAAPTLPVRSRFDSAPPAPSPRLSYADSLKRQNAIDRRVDNPPIPYSDYLRSQPKGPAVAGDTSARSDSRRKPEACPSLWAPSRAIAHAPTLGLKLADAPPPQAVRRELEVRTTYRVEVPLTSGRLVDVVM